MTDFYENKIAKVDDLIPYALNSRTHSDAQVAQIAASIREFGFTNPVLIDEKNNLIAGHGRILAARKLSMDAVPAVVVSGLDDRKRRALVIADNKLALNAGWDEEALRVELEDLAADFGELMGFSEDELVDLLKQEASEGLTDEDEVPEAPEQPVTVEGDVWILGRHRLMCGDSTSIDAVEKLMAGVSVDCVYTDPPYGINIVKGNKIGGSVLAKVGNYHPIANDDNTDVAIEAINITQSLSAKVQIIWGGNYYAQSLPNSSCWIVWDKKNGSNNFADCELAWTNQKTAVRKFEHLWNGMIRGSERDQKRVHPTQKPIALAEWCFDEYAKDCETVLDLFGGSGSTLIGCETRNKRGFIMELSAAYCDVIINRWQDFTGQEAVHEESGKTYRDIQISSQGQANS